MQEERIVKKMIAGKSKRENAARKIWEESREVDGAKRKRRPFERSRWQERERKKEKNFYP